MVLEKQAWWMVQIKSTISSFPSSVVFLVCPPKLGKPPKLLATGNWGRGQDQVGSEWDTLGTSLSPI